MHARPWHEARFRFYAELNDFLPAPRRQRAFSHRFTGAPSVKDTVEALGVPHTQIDVILVNGVSVGFGHRLQGGERVAVYPLFKRLDVSPLVRLRAAPLRHPRFIADVHLGGLARHLRLLGFDTAWPNDLEEEEIIRVATRQRRIILTRDRGILRNGRVTHGYWLRATGSLPQMEEVVRALDPGRALRPYTRCLECNGLLCPASRLSVAGRVPLQVLLVYRDFRRCPDCRSIYWSGSHRAQLDRVIARARRAAEPAGDA